MFNTINLKASDSQLPPVICTHYGTIHRVSHYQHQDVPFGRDNRFSDHGCKL